jgi:transcriptional regulator with GAF, ATPase, and Fis domain
MDFGTPVLTEDSRSSSLTLKHSIGDIALVPLRLGPAIGLQEARLLSEQKRIARELEEKVAQRTRDLQDLKEQLQRENVVLREQVDEASMFEEIVGTAPVLQLVLARVAKVAPTDSSVLITGETGTGKELIARAIHKRYARSSRAFVKVSCAAIPASLIASELFGQPRISLGRAVNRQMAPN